MKRRIDVIRSRLGRAHGEPAAPSAANSASVTVVLPAPECGAAMISPRAVTVASCSGNDASSPSSCVAHPDDLANHDDRGRLEFLFERVAGKFSRVEIRTRCFGVAAEAMMAAGVGGGRPAASNAAAIRSRLCITM